MYQIHSNRSISYKGRDSCYFCAKLISLRIKNSLQDFGVLICSSDELKETAEAWNSIVPTPHELWPVRREGCVHVV